jgi:hypothetical protein
MATKIGPVDPCHCPACLGNDVGDAQEEFSESLI